MRTYRVSKLGTRAFACALSALLALQAPAIAFSEETGSSEAGITEDSANSSSESTESTDKDGENKDKDKNNEQNKVDFNKINEGLNQQMEMALNTLASLSTEAELAEYDLLSVTDELNKINAHIAELDALIPQTQSDLETRRTELAELIAETYKEGSPTLLDVMVDVTSFEDLISRVDYANRLSQYTSGKVTETKDLGDKLVQQRSDLEIEKAKQEQLVTEQEQRLAAVEAAASSMQAYYNQLSEDVQKMIEIEQNATQTANAELAREAAAEAQRIAAELGSGAPAAGAASGDSSATGSAAYSAAAFVANAFSIIGAGYQWSGYNWVGSISGSAFTCSGVIDFARGRPSRSSSPEILYAEVGSRLVTDVSKLHYGDLVFYSYAGRNPGHVGIYIGGGSIIDSIPNGGVAIRDVSYMPFIGGGPIY